MSEATSKQISPRGKTFSDLNHFVEKCGEEHIKNKKK
jgi:hypothetical protein